MPKYILIGLAIIIGSFFIMRYWSKLTAKGKNKIIVAIFGLIALAFVMLLILLFN
jgi:uncharacterized membrane protein YqhA